MLGKGLGLDGQVYPAHLGAHLKVHHHRGNWWEGCAAILCGQDFLHRDEMWTKVIGARIGTWWGPMIETHVMMSSGVCVQKTSVFCLQNCFLRSQGNQALSQYVQYRSTSAPQNHQPYPHLQMIYILSILHSGNPDTSAVLPCMPKFHHGQEHANTCWHDMSSSSEPTPMCLLPFFF